MTSSGRRNTRRLRRCRIKCGSAGALHRHQEGVIDIAVAIFPEVQDPALGGELLGHGQPDDPRFVPLL